MQQRPEILSRARKNICVVTECPQRFHVSSTCFPQPFIARLLPAFSWRPPSWRVRRRPRPTPTLYRVFLTDGSTLVSYGEFARVADLVVLSLPLGGTPAAPRLQL